MINKNLNSYANKLVNAFLKNKIISPLPSRYTKKISEAQKFRKLCESKIKKPISGFKAAGTGIPVLKKLKEKEPFYSSIFKKFKLPILIGISRKSMIYNYLKTTPERALNGTSIINTIALQNGANILRVHDVKEAMECIKITKFVKNHY